MSLPTSTWTTTAVEAASTFLRDSLQHIEQRATASDPAPTGYFDTTEFIIIPGATDDHFTQPAKTIKLTMATCKPTITPDANGYVPPGTCNAIWNYYPSFYAAAVFAGLFFLLIVVHIWLAARHKKRWCWVIIMANIWEATAFTSRTISTKHQQSEGIYLIFQIFILLAPLWVNAFAYMVLGRMIHFFLPSQSILRVPAYLIAACFVLLDIVSFVIQLVGGMSANPRGTPESLRKALNIYMGGIALQEVFIIFFVCLAIKFQLEVRKLTHLKSTKSAKSLTLALYFSLSMVSIRIFYRLAEFSKGSLENPLTTKEAYFFVLEAAPMFLASAVFVVVHPGAIITGPGSEMPTLRSRIRAMFRRDRAKLASVDEEEQQELTTTHYISPAHAPR